MKVCIPLGEYFNHQFVGVRFVSCLTVARIDIAKDPEKRLTHQRIQLEASFGESQHSFACVYSNDIPITEIKEQLIDLTKKISDFSKTPEFDRSVGMISKVTAKF